jgi:glycerophosphoryl diester phosphodiesterase
MAAILVTGISSIPSPAQAPLIIAHRGASHAAPENTVAAMELAWKEGADGVEGDFHLTRDGEVVCVHDDDTRRTTGVKKLIRQSTWAELQSLDAGSWKAPEFRDEGIPRLADMLDHLPAGKLLFIEVKSGPAILAPIKAILESREGMVDPKAIFIISFDAAVVAEARRLMPDLQAHLVTSLEEFGDAAGMGTLDETLSRCGATGLQFQFRPAITGEWIGSLRSRGLLTDCWVVNDARRAAKVAAMGVGFITTDRPGPLRKELKAALDPGR